ncbi:hypothetical protein DFH06DRAFT_1157930 [Mycena polygramma]|nr:hypothetical protein DFH06DRAFT_1157930 [Mycena polygramma]
MFSFAVLALAAASANAHSFSHVRRHHVPRSLAPAGWATSYLETYDAYHSRYMGLHCESKHNTTFFDTCCHPLLATETVAKNRPACCAAGATVPCPGASSSSVAAAHTSPSSSAAHPKSTAADNDDEDCDDEDDENTDDEDDEEECEDEGEEDASTMPTKVPATSHIVKASTHTPTTSIETTTTAKAATTHTTPKAVSTPKTTTTPEATSILTAATSAKTATGDFITGGFGTWFTQNGVAGACGKVHRDTDFVVALQTEKYAHGANCGRMIRVTDLTTGKTVDGLVADECPTCDNTACVDMSLGMFKAFTSLSVGMFKIKYQFLD